MAVVGDIGKTELIEVVSRGVKGSTNLAKGDILSFDANGYARAALTSDWTDVGFGVAIEAGNNTSGADDAIVIRIAVGNTWVYVQSGGVIKPMHLVKAASQTTVVSHAFAADVTATVSNVDANNAKYAFALTFGRYIAHENEEKDATDAANTDVILVRLGV